MPFVDCLGQPLLLGQILFYLVEKHLENALLVIGDNLDFNKEIQKLTSYLK
jgi:hypothetical protein